MSAAGSIHASAVLRRRAAGEDLGDDAHRHEDDAFWAAAPRLYDFSKQGHQSPPPAAAPSPLSSPPAAEAPFNLLCLLTLRSSGGGWGVRKRVRYVGRHRARRAAQEDPAPAVDAAAVLVEGDEESASNGKKRSRPEEEETAAEVKAEEAGSQDERKVLRTEKKRKRQRKTSRGRVIADRPKETQPKETETKPAPKVEQAEASAPPRAMVDRWKANRYASAEASLLGILRARGARAGEPILRGKLREEARRHIGDTGLLDHLLKHVADKVPAGSAERFRRRHNADGAMEYWLEPAELAALRREAGVADRYWLPPPGWKLGDPVTPEACTLEVKRQVEELAAELAGVKRFMEQLNSSVVQVSKEMEYEVDKAYISYQEKYGFMVKANGNLVKRIMFLEEKCENTIQAKGELEEEVLILKEKYEAVLEKNTRLEEQMAALSTSLLSLKEGLLLLNAGEQYMMEMEQDELCVEEPCKVEKQEGNAGMVPDNAAVGAGNNQPADAMAAVDADATISSGGGADARAGSGKRTSRKCSVRICKPQGTFQWPDTALPVLAHASPPTTPTAEAAVAADADAVANLAFMDELHELMMAGGLSTPPSASSTNAAAARLPLLPAPASPVQPPPLPPPTTSARDVLQTETAQPYSGLGSKLRHTDTSSSSSAPCGASLLEGKKTTMVDAGDAGGNVGTELALATPTVL